MQKKRSFDVCMYIATGPAKIEACEASITATLSVCVKNESRAFSLNIFDHILE